MAQTSGFYSTVLLCVPLICFLVGPCGLFLSIAKDVANDIRILGMEYDKNQNERQMEWKIKENLCNAVQLFADAKQLNLNSFGMKKYGENDIEQFRFI